MDTRPPEVDIVLYWPEVRRVIGHVPKRNINTISSSVISNLIKGVAFIEHRASNKQVAYARYRKIVETYHELLCLAADTGLAQRLYDVYIKSFDLMQEGQNDLFNSDELVDKSKALDSEVRYRVLMDKYHVQHEGNLRYSITPAIFALDVISGHKDLHSKSYEEYCRDDLSYKVQKLIDQNQIRIRGDVSAIKEGIEPHIRNSISHRTFEYMDTGEVTFLDQHRGGTWQKKMSFAEFEQLVFTADNAIHAHAAAQTLFVHDYHKAIDFKQAPLFTTVKQLRALIDQRMLKLYLDPTDITISSEDSIISCAATKRPGTDYPSEMFAMMGGIHFHRTRPAMKAEEQALALLEYIAALGTTYKRCVITISDSDEKTLLGTIEADLTALTAIKRSPTGTKEEFEAQIQKNTFPR